MQDFYFDHIFDPSTKQEQVFEGVAKDVVDSCFDGYNGTIFAYGQTGSGKTYTITGGTERYVDRGLIPRTLSYIFKEMQSRTNASYKVSLSILCSQQIQVSYLEIYNDQGYDLLDVKNQSTSLLDLPKVSLMENSNGVRFIAKNGLIGICDARLVYSSC